MATDGVDVFIFFGEGDGGRAGRGRLTHPGVNVYLFQGRLRFSHSEIRVLLLRTHLPYQSFSRRAEMHKSRCVEDNIDEFDEECFLFLFQPQLLHDVLRSYRCTVHSMVSGPAVAAKGKNGITTNHESAFISSSYHLEKLASS